MGIEEIDLRAELRLVRAAFDEQLAEVLRQRTDLTHAQIAQQFGVSNKVIRVIGCDFRPEVQGKLAELGFDSFNRTSEGFEATRPLPPPLGG